MKLSLPLTGKLAVILILVSALLAGCGAFTPAQPTVSPLPTTDPATYVAAAVQTLAAQMTEEALRNPTATATPEPTATLEPTITPIPVTPTPAMSPTPVATQAPPLSAQALYAAAYPENKTERVPNEKFSLALGFKNTGSITWEPGYRVKIVNFEGEITVQQEVELGKSVAAGEKVEFNLWAYGSETLGKHVWVFQLYTPNGAAVPGGGIAYTYTSK